MDDRDPRPRDPWDREPNETPSSYDAFRRYLQMGGERNIAELERRDGRTYRALASEHRWTARADAWDRHAERIRTENTEDAIAEMGRRHIAAIEPLFAATLAEARRALAVVQSIDPADTKQRPRAWKELVHTLSEIVKLERLVRGEPTDRSAIDLSRLTSADLERILSGG